MTEQQAAARRKSVRRTVLVVACVALAIYAGFIAMGLLSQRCGAMSDRRAAVNASALAKMIGVALAAFAFTFALVPLYRIACEKVFGVRLEQGAGRARPRPAGGNDARWVTVQFDGGVNSKLPWAFRPEQADDARASGPAVRGEATSRATPATTPSSATRCRRSRRRARRATSARPNASASPRRRSPPGESRDMPVRFIVDPDAAGRRQHDHAVLYLLQERRADRAAADAPAAARRRRRARRPDPRTDSRQPEHAMAHAHAHAHDASPRRERLLRPARQPLAGGRLGRAVHHHGRLRQLVERVQLGPVRCSSSAW